MDLGLAGRAFVVTGGSRGLGLAAAYTLLEEGAQVVIAGRDEESLAEATHALGHSGQVVALAADLADPSAAERLVAGAVARFGRIDGALLSVGGPPPGTALTVTDEAWRSSFESVFLGPLRVARAISAAITSDPAALTGTEGSLVFVLSSSVRNPIAGLSVSNGLRPGLAMVVKDLADELGPRGVRVNGMLPGRLATDRTFAIDARVGSPDMVRRRNEVAIPLGRYGEPAEFAAAAAFLLSPVSSYVTGSMLAVDGGSTRSI
ncbi:MAG: SDR family oxidoreductase [Actinomycetota bacterium]|nr:MAG: SDR family oxidoreductase [Actinomycetota bacterium]